MPATDHESGCMCDECILREQRAADARANNPENTVGGKPPPFIQELIDKGFKGIPSWLFNSMITSLVSTAIHKLPTEKKLQALMYLAELLWPGSTEKTS